MALTEKQYRIAQKDIEAFERYIKQKISYKQLREIVCKNHNKKIPDSKIDEWLNQGWTEDFRKGR